MKNLMETTMKKKLPVYSLILATLGLSLASPAMADQCLQYADSWISRMKSFNSTKCQQLMPAEPFEFAVWDGGPDLNYTPAIAHSILLNICKSNGKSDCVVTSGFKPGPAGTYCFTPIGGTVEEGQVNGEFRCGKRL
jgi:hypothetical protein